MEEYLNLYHQKLWEIAYENLIRTFFHPYTIILFALFLIIWYLFFGKNEFYYLSLVIYSCSFWEESQSM